MNESAPPVLSRRELLRGAVLLVGGAASTLPTDLWARDEAPRFFDNERFAVLEAVCETLIPTTDTPGAVGAGVPTGIDALMRHWASAQRRQQFTSLLDAINDAATAQAGAGLPLLAPPQQLEVVSRFDAERIRTDSVYAKFKELVVRLYYLSEVGATQELRYDPVPGRWEPAVKINADTRSWADPG